MCNSCCIRGERGRTGRTGPTGEQGIPGPDEVFVNNTVFVDEKYGDDITGTREEITKPFASIQAALLAAQTGDTVYVQPGTYIGQFILVNGVDIYLSLGVIINSDDSDTFLANTPVTCQIYGHAECVVNDNLLVLNAVSDVYFSADIVSLRSSAIVRSSVASKVTMDVKKITATGSQLITMLGGGSVDLSFDSAAVGGFINSLGTNNKVNIDGHFLSVTGPMITTGSLDCDMTIDIGEITSTYNGPLLNCAQDLGTIVIKSSKCITGNTLVNISGAISVTFDVDNFHISLPNALMMSATGSTTININSSDFLVDGGVDGPLCFLRDNVKLNFSAKNVDMSNAITFLDSAACDVRCTWGLAKLTNLPIVQQTENARTYISAQKLDTSGVRGSNNSLIITTESTLYMNIGNWYTLFGTGAVVLNSNTSDVYIDVNEYYVSEEGTDLSAVYNAFYISPGSKLFFDVDSFYFGLSVLTIFQDEGTMNLNVGNMHITGTSIVLFKIFSNEFTNIKTKNYLSNDTIFMNTSNGVGAVINVDCGIMNFIGGAVLQTLSQHMINFNFDYIRLSGSTIGTPMGIFAAGETHITGNKYEVFDNINFLITVGSLQLTNEDYHITIKEILSNGGLNGAINNIYPGTTYVNVDYINIGSSVNIMLLTDGTTYATIGEIVPNVSVEVIGIVNPAKANIVLDRCINFTSPVLVTNDCTNVYMRGGIWETTSDIRAIDMTWTVATTGDPTEATVGAELIKTALTTGGGGVINYTIPGPRANMALRVMDSVIVSDTAFSISANVAQPVSLGYISANVGSSTILPVPAAVQVDGNIR